MKGLEAARSHHLEEARRQAADVVRRARAEADGLVAGARVQAGRILAQAREEGAAAADLDSRREWIAALRRSRTDVLGARREAVERLRGALVRDIPADPRYPALAWRLADRAKAQLGGTALIEVDPPGRPGVFGRAPGRSVDYSVTALAERLVAEAGTRIEELWA